MAQQLTPKAKQMAKDEVMLFLDLISKYKIITAKATNAETNRLKEDAWTALTKEFCVMTGEMRRKEQLYSKWDNMKKALRRRIEKIRETNLETRKKIFIPRDEVLDRVASILEATCGGVNLENGDEESSTPPDEILDRVDPLIGTTYSESTEEYNGDTEEISETFYVVQAVPESEPEPPKEPPQPEVTEKRRKKPSEELQRAQKEKELAMAAYFRVMAEKVELEKIKLLLEIEQLKKSDSGVNH